MSDRFLAELPDDIADMVGEVSQDDLFSLLEMVDGNQTEFPPLSPLHEIVPSLKGGEKKTTRITTKRSTSWSTRIESDEAEMKGSSSYKKQKLMTTPLNEEVGQDSNHRTVHITVERSRRKQMNDNLSVIRALMPPFYVKRGDQASIIGGVVDYIKELQQVLQSLELKKQRKIYNEVLSPRLVSSPRSSPLSPRKPPMSPLSPLSPKLSLPVSPMTPTQTSPYKAQQSYMSTCTSPYNKATTIQQGYISSTISTANEPYYPSSSSSSSFLAAKAASVAEVEVKFAGLNLLLKTKSGRVRGQVLKVIEALEALSLEILHVSISTLDDTMFNSFTIKVGIECQLSAEELAHEIQQTFC